MKFLLVGINAKYIHSNPAIRSLYAYVGAEHQKNVELSEYTINHRREDILADLYERKPDVIGFSCYIWNFAVVKSLLFDLAQIMPEVKIWLGGPEVSFDGRNLLEEYPMVEGIMTGEGEATFRELMEYYETYFADESRSNFIGEKNGSSEVNAQIQRTLSDIKGVILRSGHTPCREVLSLDEVPFLYEDLADFENRIIYYESSRGCPFRCSYCLSSVAGSVRFRSMELVKKELQFFLDHKVPQVKFIDRTFNCNKEHALAIWNYIKENDNGVTNFHFEIAADILSPEEIDLLATLRPGLVQLEIGVQSTNEQTLAAINRPAKTERLREIVEKLLKQGNIHIHLDLIAGLPYENYESFARSFQDVYEMRPHQLQLGFLKVLKGSPMEEMVEEHGIRYQKEPPYEVLATGLLSYEEIRRLKQIEEMVELYHNSSQFRYTLPALLTEYENPFDFFAELAEYYKEQGYRINTPARGSRYEILLDFACRKNPSKEDLYRELLTFDFYLREKAKSRPSFAPSGEFMRDEIWAFYCREEEKPAYLSGYGTYHARQLMKMTHMEGFRYAVWEGICGEVRELEEPALVLFDYRKRNPLTFDAKYSVIGR